MSNKLEGKFATCHNNDRIGFCFGIFFEKFEIFFERRAESEMLIW